MESSSDEGRGNYRRLFARTAALTMALMLGLVAAEVLFPAADAEVKGGAIGVELYDFQLLLMVCALVSCVASLVGLGIVAFLDGVDSRKARRRRTMEARLRHPTGWTTNLTAPSGAGTRYERLRALRDAAHSLEKP